MKAFWFCRRFYLIQLCMGLLCHWPVAAQIERIWLTHRSPDPGHLVVNWETTTPGNSVVRFGPTPDMEQVIKREEEVTLHHVEIPLLLRDTNYHYGVATGEHRSPPATFKAYPRQELRVAVIANWGYARPDLTALRRDEPHLVLTAGDNVPNLHQLCGEDVTDCTRPFSKLIDAAPELFRATPFLPVLGNHDREIRPRGPKPTPQPGYDVEAIAFRKFFELPGDEWKWTFFIPDFNARFIALDLNHTSDFGTTWQTCHDFHRNSGQFEWYRRLIATNQARFTITLHNEQNQRVRTCEAGAWARLFQQGTAIISGFGYYAERAEVEGFPYFNTSLCAGDKYPDAESKFLEALGGYILLTFSQSGPMRVELKTLDGRVLERTMQAGRSR